jgi:hypothetical protein
MSFTRFHDDEARIKKRLDEITYIGRYQLDAYGPGDKAPFMNDPHIRLQKYGANLRDNTVNLESDLYGLTRKLNRDNIKINEYRNFKALSSPQSYSEEDPTTEESRATHPAWMYKTVDVDRWETPILNPQENLDRPFQFDIHTRILEKDYFKPQIPQFFGSPSLATTQNEPVFHSIARQSV